MKKKIVLLLTVLLCVLCCPFALREVKAATDGDWEYEVLEDGTVEITGYNGNDTAVTVPATLGGKKVAGIGREALNNCDFTSVDISNGIEYIGVDAFWHNDNLVSVKLPESLIYIYRGAFYECRGLQYIYIPARVKYIGPGAFSDTSLNDIEIDSDNKIYRSVDNVIYTKDMSELIYCPQKKTSIAIPSGVKIIGEDAFYSTSITSINLPEGVEIIGDFAFGFSSCSLRNINLPSTLKSIGEGAFKCCTGLGMIDIPEGVSAIGEQAFSDCYGLWEVNIPDSVLEIGGFSFWDTPWLECKQKENPLVVINDILIDGSTVSGECVIPDNVVSISGFAFLMNDNITKVIIPDTVTELKYATFDRCSNLVEAVIPESVTNIEWGAFIDSPDLTINCVYDSAAYWYAINSGIPCKSEIKGTIESGIEYIYDDGILTISGNGELSDLHAIPWEVRDNVNVVVIEDGITSVGGFGGFGFGTLPNIESVMLPDSVTKIDNGAFRYCRQLKEINLPSNLLSIGEWAFDYCESIAAITIPASVTTIEFNDYGGAPFSGCSALEDIYVESGNSYYTSYDGCLYNKDKSVLIRCPEGKSAVTIFEETEQITDRAFRDCSLITSIKLPNRIKNLGWGTFWGCSELEKVLFPDDFESVSDNTFGNCYKFSAINLTGDSGKNVIINGCLYNADKTKLILVPVSNSVYALEEGLLEIGAGALAYNQARKQIKIPDSVQKIGDGAFLECKAGLIFNGEPPELGYAAIKVNMTDGYVQFLPSVKWNKYVRCCAGTYEAGGFEFLYEGGERGWLTTANLRFTGLFEASGNIYYFTEGKLDKAFNGTANYGDKTYVVRAGKAITELSAPKLTSIANSATGVTFKWGEVDFADGYYVYRKTSGGSWSRIAEIKNGSTVSYTDKTAKSGTAYTYTVKAYAGVERHFIQPCGDAVAAN